MKTWIRGLGVLVLLGVGLAGWVLWLDAQDRVKAFDAALEAAPTGSPNPSPELMARGAYLARVGNCASCHTARGGMSYAGGRAIGTPFGTVYAGNLTPDAQTGLGRWSADDFWRAMHHGRSRDGHLLNPAFPYASFTRVLRGDSDALFAYLQQLPPVAQANRAHALRFPFNTQVALMVWRALYFKPAVFVPEPAQSDAWNRGAYWVTGLGHCAACHAPRNRLGASVRSEELGGGMIATQGWYAPSLSDTHEAGVLLGKTQAIVDLLKTGHSGDATALGPMAEVVMRSTQYMALSDLNDMALYLQSLSKRQDVNDASKLMEPAASTQAVHLNQGEKIYADHCAQCHGEQGQGVRGMYVAMAGNRAVTMAKPVNLIRVVVEGGFAPATAANPRPFGMPPFRQTLDDAQIAAVLSYIRQAWGNHAPAVSPLEVLQNLQANEAH